LFDFDSDTHTEQAKRGTREKLGGETILKDLAVIASAALPLIDFASNTSLTLRLESVLR